MELYLSGVMRRKKVQIAPFQTKDVFKLIDICLASSVSDGFNQVLSGNYAGQQIKDIKNYQNDDVIVTALFNIELIFTKYNVYSIEDGVNCLFNDLKNEYLIFEDENIKLIGNEKLISKCKVAFDEVAVVDYDDLTIEKENMFKMYDIEGKYQYLKEHIYGQDEQLKIFLSCMIKNRNLIDHNFSQEMIADMKSTVLLIGSTGVGKTMMVKHVAKLFDIPHVIEDATRYTISGFSGEDIENMLRNLYSRSGECLKKAEEGILFIDEFDKLCSTDDKNMSVATTGVQQSLLKMIEGGKFYISRTNHTSVGDFEFDTSRLTVVLSGAFQGIEKIVEKRCAVNKMGFNSGLPVDELQPKSVQDQDLENYGVIPELIGRISNTIELSSPRREDLKNALLYSKSSVLLLWQSYLEKNGLSLEFDEEFVDAIVTQTVNLKTGYRGLNKTLNYVIEREQYDLMTGKTNVLSLTSDKVKKIGTKKDL